MKKLFVTLLIITISIASIFAIGAMDSFAYADNTEEAISDVEAVWALQTSVDPYPNPEVGIQFEVYCSQYANSLSYSFQNDISEEESGTLELSPKGDEKGHQTASFLVKKNGVYKFTANITYQGETYDVDSDELIIDDIDSACPVLLDHSKDIWDGYLIYYKSCYRIEDGWHYVYTASDDVTTQDFTSKHSGLARILVFSMDVLQIPENYEELLKEGEDLPGVNIAYDHDYSNDKNQPIYETDFEFDMIESGFYFVYMEDRAGNHSAIEFLKMHYPDEPMFVTVNGERVNIADQIENAETIVKNGTDTYTKDLLNELNTKAQAVRNAFEQQLTDAETKEIYNEFSVTYRKILAAKVEFFVSVTNPELLDGTITLGNFDETSFDGLKKGDKVYAEIVIAEIPSNKFPGGVLALSKVTEPEQLIKISYKFVKDGEMIVPEHYISLKITWNESVVDSDIVGVNAEDGSFHAVDSYGGTSGTKWISFYSKEGAKEFYAVMRYTEVEEKEEDLTWLWILLGTLGGVIIIAIPLFFFIVKPKLLPKLRKKKAISTSKEQEATPKNEDASLENDDVAHNAENDEQTKEND